MDTGEQFEHPTAADRLDSWKEIAAYLNRSVRTVHRWEAHEGLPVHRLQHEKRGSVYAHKAELDSWWESRNRPNASSAPGLSEENLPPRKDASRLPIARWTKPLSVVLAGVIAVTYAIRQSGNSDGRPLEAVPLTTFPGNETQPSISPDGEQVAFAFAEGDSARFHIQIQGIGSNAVTRLTSGPANDLSPSWSPDGRTIAFLRFVSEEEALVMLMPSAGGSERQLARLLINRTEASELRVAWSPDGEWLATSEMATRLSPVVLILVSARTGEKRKLIYHPRTLEADLSPSFSPDGQHLAFTRHLSPAVADIYTLELSKDVRANPQARRLTNWNRMNTNPVWSGDGRDIFFVGDESPLHRQIWRVSAFGGTDARPLGRIGEDSSSLAICPRRNRLVYSKETKDTNIWRIDLSSAAMSPEGRGDSASRLIASTRLETNAQYSPDGRYIAYQSERSGNCEIWVANSDGSASRHLTRLGAKVSGYPRWSPDGKLIAFHSRPEGYANIYVINVESGAYRRMTSGATNDIQPSWSHDGKWIYFSSQREDGLQIWKMPAGGGPASRLTKTGGMMAAESSDGKLLYHSSPAAPGLWALQLEGKYEETQVLPSLYTGDTFAVAGRGIYYIAKTGDLQSSFGFRAFSTGSTQELAKVKTSIGMGLSVSPDASSILYTQEDQTGSDLILVDNLK